MMAKSAQTIAGTMPPEAPNMKRRMRILFFTIELNLTLWAMTVVAVFNNPEMLKPIVITGFALAALVQHWAYYAVYKAAQTD
jgi:hypothetical protein